MILKRPNKLLLLLFSIVISCHITLYSDVLTGESLNNDLDYYKKVSAQKNLNSNDRTYILNRIEKKYEGSGVDTAPLQLELDKAAKGSAPAGTRVREKSVPALGTTPLRTKGKVEKIFVSETSAESKILITASGVERSNYFLMKGPDPAKPSRIVLDLYGVKSKLSKAAQDISPKQGLFSNISAGQFEGPPNNVVRITAELRKDSPYTVKKQGDIWLISASKIAQDAPAGVSVKPLIRMPEVSGTAPETVAVSSGTAAAPAAFSQSEEVIPETPDKTTKPVSKDYQIENGDILGITIYPADELSRESIVQEDGNIPFPLIGSAHAKGLTAKQLEEGLAQSLGRFISTPQVTVTIKMFSRRQIFVTGEVKSVGAFNYKENLRLMEFISSLGGFSDSADRKAVKIYRGPPTKRQTHIVNVEELIKSGDFSKDFLLEPGDIIEVQKGQPKIAVLGEIRSAGYYDYRENMMLVELISLAGGFTDNAKIKSVSIIHTGQDNRQSVSKVDLNKILSGKQKDIPVQSGDTIYIPKGNLASANWFLSNILPWLSLFSVLLLVRVGL